MGVGEKPISGMCVKPNIFRSVLIFMLNIWGVDSKYRNTAVVFAPFFGAQVSTFKKRTLGPPFSWAPDNWAPGQLGPLTVGPRIDVGAQLQKWYLSNILHISDKYEKLAKIIISRQFQHINPEKFVQISLWNFVFPYQLYQKQHRYLRNNSRNLFTIRHFTHIWNCFTQALIVVLVTDIMSAQLFLFKAGLG